ncbi:MAG: hypothetical protein ACI9U2_001885 [Bradymonadia bacterium]|jgi:hypothetical protein
MRVLLIGLIGLIGLVGLIGLTACQVELEADPTQERVIVLPVEADLGIDVAVDAAPPPWCPPAPAEVRRDDVPIGQPVKIIVPLGCGDGLQVHGLSLTAVSPSDAIHLDTPADLRLPLQMVELVYTPRAIGERASAVLYVNSDQGDFAVPIGASSRWTDAACRPWRVSGEGAEVEERSLVRLDAFPPAGVADTAATVLWSVIEQPDGADGLFAESVHFDDPTLDTPDDPNTPGAWFALTQPGLYTLECTVKPPSGANCPAQITRLRVQRCPCPDDLSVGLTWRALDDREVPANLDLHLLHPTAQAWDAPGLDCSPADFDPRWTSDLALDRPRHTGDDAITPGFERVALPRAEGIDAINAPYRIGVRNTSVVTVEATIRVFLTDRMVWTTTRRIAPSDAFWDVGAIGWHDGMLVALPFDRLLDDRRPDPWAPLPAGMACLPDMDPPCQDACSLNDGAFSGRCQ